MKYTTQPIGRLMNYNGGQVDARLDFGQAVVVFEIGMRGCTSDLPRGR